MPTITDPPIVQPTNLTGFPLTLHQYTNITPFTYRDGITYLEKLEGISTWLRTVLVPHIDGEVAQFGDAWNTEVTELEAAVNLAMTTQSDTVNTAIDNLVTQVNAAIQEIIDADVTITDPIVHGMIATVNSQTRLLLDSLYAAHADLDAVQATAASAATTAGNAQTTANAAHVFINAKEGPYNAVGDGVTDDTVALQAAIDAATGRTLFIPAGTYMVNANFDNALHVGLKVRNPKTHIILDDGATLKVITNNLTNYVLISITAADAVIEGGVMQGDVSTHTGTTGEWGHLIVVDAGADRCTLRDIDVKEAWGDGITIQRGPSDVSVINITADSNRRQGMSITGAIRARVIGGVYKNTGLIGITAPAAGIDVEPNPGTGYDVIDCVISSVIVSGNKGPGILTIRANTQTTDVQIDNCKASNNGSGVAGFPYSNFAARGSGNGAGRTRFTNCVSVGAGLHGVELFALGAEAVGCRSRASAQHGFEVSGAGAIVMDCNAEENGQHGIHVASTASGAMIMGGVSQANSQAATNTYDNVYVDVTGNIRLIGHNAYAGVLANKPKYGFEIAVGAGIRMFGCDISGTYGTANFLNSSTSTIVPLPGFTKAATIASPTAPSAAYVQAEAQSMKTAVDAIRTVLASFGMTG